MHVPSRAPGAHAKRLSKTHLPWRERAKVQTKHELGMVCHCFNQWPMSLSLSATDIPDPHSEIIRACRDNVSSKWITLHSPYRLSVTTHHRDGGRQLSHIPLS